jgi:sarcosine oxidase subunit beta
MAEHYDAIIIGAGIMGCSAAFELARRGLKVVVLEKAYIGSGSTGESSAIIRQHYSNALTARMAKYSLGVFQNFADVVGGESGFTRTGFIALVNAKDRAGLERNVALQQSLGIRTELLSPVALAAIMPGLETSDLLAAAYEPESGYADPNLTVNSYAEAARRHGVHIRVQTAVTGIRFAAGRVQAVATDKGEFQAPLVLNAAGPWGARVAQMAGIDVPISPCRVQVAFFRRPATHEGVHPVVADFINATYFRSETGGLTLVGLIDPAEAEAIVDPQAYPKGLDDDFVISAGERLVRRFPAMEQSRVTGGYASLYAITPDWHPLVDELIPGSGCFICAGFSGHGFKLGPAVGVMAAEMMTGASQPLFDPHLFRINRYQQGEPVRGLYDYSIVG